MAIKVNAMSLRFCHTTYSVIVFKFYFKQTVTESMYNEQSRMLSFSKNFAKRSK